MLVILLTMAAQTAWADDVNITADGSTISTATTWTNCTVNITGSGTVTFSNRITISGDVTLNISAGATLTATIGITVNEGNSLTIAGDGSLTAGAYGGDYHSAAIGGTQKQNSGTINITGGTINATGNGGGAGIGGGDEGSATIINISGGNITATGSNWSAGIGGGCKGSAGTITITGGVVNATGAYKGAGIGGGGDSDNPGGGGTITISGGQVTATGGKDGGNPCGYGIGPGKDGTLGTISLSWTESTDFISASSYKGNISFESGKRFYYNGTTDYVTADRLANSLNQKIIPAVANNNSLAYADIQMPRYYITTNGTAVGVDYDVYDYNGNKLTKGTHYTAVIKNSSDNEVTTFDQLGDYTLTITGTGTTYTGSKSFTFSLVEWDPNLTEDGSDHSINFPADGTKKTVYLGKNQTIKVYDSEGKDGNLVVSDGRLMLYAPEGYALEVTGKTDAQFWTAGLYYAWLKAYEGNEATEGTLITTIEQNSDNISFASGGNGMLMRFNAQQVGSNKYGLDLTVRVVEATPHNITVVTADNGSIESDKTSAKANETVTLTVNPASGYLLKSITVTDTDNSTTIATIGEDNWYSGANTVTLQMPNKNVTLTPEFANVLSTDDGLTLNIDPLRTTEYVIPEGVKSFNITGQLTNSASLTAVLKAPEDVRLLATGNCTLSTSYDIIRIYDGASSSANLLKELTTSDEAIGTQTSTSNYMTFVINGSFFARLNGKIEMVYSISYDLNGGSLETANPATYTYHTNAFTLNNPETNTLGYEFAGWTGTGLDAASTNVTIAKGSYGNRSYTATWTPIAYTITYNGVEGATFANANPATYTVESAAITLNNPTREGYTFAGWTGTGLDAATTSVTIAAGSTGARTYTATWTPIVYTITYNAGDGATFSTTYYSYTIESAAITLDEPTRTGYDFGGWYDNSGLTGDAVTTIAAGSTGDVVLWAKWTPTFTGGLTLAVVENKLTATLDGTALTELSIPTDITVESVVLNREFASGKCATIMLPFSMDVSNISGTNFYTFGGVEKNSSDKWIATMNQVTGTLTANTPYLVEPTGTTLTFTGGATLNTTGGGQQTADEGSNWTFKGTYAARYWYDGTDGVNAAQNADEIGKAYGFAGVQKTGIEVGDFVKVQSGAKIRPMGCYLLWSDTPNAAPARRMTRGAAADELPSRITVRLVGSNGETTAIGELDTRTGEISMDGWWTLDGVKLSGKPAKKGLYIHNGRKEVLK